MNVSLFRTVCCFAIAMSAVAVAAQQRVPLRTPPATQQQGPASGTGQLASPGIQSQLDAAVVQHAKDRNLPGLVVLYARDGLLVYRKTVGFADVQTATPVTENHIFRMASVSKLFAGALAMRLQETGKLELDSRVDSILEDIPAHHSYRLKDLLSCRSGVRHYGGEVSPQSPANWASQHYDTALEAAENLWNDPLAGPVGQYRYSTHGYTILAAAMEQAAGKPVGELVGDLLAEPHGLATLAAEDRSVNRPERVTLYRLKDPENAASGNLKATPDEISWKVLGGGLECSAIDLLRFGIRLCDGQIISKASLKVMIQRPDPLESYALGCNQAYENGVEVFAKDGGQLGVSSYLWCAPEKRMVMVVLTNRHDRGGAPELGKKLRSIVLNTAAASGQKPDLTVQDFRKTGNPVWKDGKWEIPVRFTVRNEGKAAAAIQFVNAVRAGNQFRWSGFMDPMAPNGTEREVSGVVKVPDAAKVLSGRTVELFATADAPIAGGDTDMSPDGRIAESLESNNEAVLSVGIPGGTGDLKAETGNGGRELPRPKRIPPRRQGG